MPGDRIIEGVDQLHFLTGKQERSNRESVIIYVGDELYGVKWRNWEMLTKMLSAGFFEPVKQYSSVPLFFDLLADPKEEHPSDLRMTEDLWVRFPMSQVLVEHLASFKREPPIAPGTPDPYVPAAAAE